MLQNCIKHIVINCKIMTLKRALGIFIFVLMAIVGAATLIHGHGLIAFLKALAIGLAFGGTVLLALWLVMDIK